MGSGGCGCRGLRVYRFSQGLRFRVFGPGPGVKGLGVLAWPILNAHLLVSRIVLPKGPITILCVGLFYLLGLSRE